MLHTMLPQFAAHIRLSALACLASTTPILVAADPDFSLTTSKVGISADAVTDIGYPGQHNRMTGGACVADFNADTYPDIFVPGLGTSPDKLYINNQDGTFTERGAQWGVDRVHLGKGVAAGDLNNDGYPELYVASMGDIGLDGAKPGVCILYENRPAPGANPSGRVFVDIAQEAGVNEVLGISGGMTPAFGDIDLDGDLDLVVATWEFFQGGNRLFENQSKQTGKIEFVDITSASLSAPDREAIMRGFVPHIVDITGDRYPEILMSADFRTSELFVNNGVDASGRASFRTVTNKANIAQDFNAMGASVADFNGDGLLDWFQTNIYSTPVRGNTLYMLQEIDEQGDPIFANEAFPRGVVNNGWGWGVVNGDFDNDTDQDLIATNGWPGWPNETTRYWSNDGNGFFTDLPIQAGLLFNINGRAIVSLDHDKDMDLDLVFIDNQGPIRFYSNNLVIEDGFTNALRVRLDTSLHPCHAPDGQGAMVRATIDGVTQLHPVHNNASYLGQSELTVHIGMGEATVIDTLEISWADGSVTTRTNLDANQEITIRATHPADLNEDGQLDYFDASRLLALYRAGVPEADFNEDNTLDNNDILDFIASFNTACQ